MKEQSINYTKRIRVVGIVVDLNEEGKTIQLPASLLSLLPCQPCHRNSTLTVSNRSTRSSYMQQMLLPVQSGVEYDPFGERWFRRHLQISSDASGRTCKTQNNQIIKYQYFEATINSTMHFAKIICN